MAIHRKDGLVYYTFDQLDREGLLHGIFMRHGGCSPQPWRSLNLATSVGDTRENVIANRDRISDALGIARNSFHDVWQVHSSKVVIAREARRVGEPHVQADGIVTDQDDVAILMLFADCVPILFYDPKKNIAACAHAGWQGTFKQVAAQTVKTMSETYSSEPQDILACVGPSICQDHYQVGEEVVAAADSLFDRHEGVIRKSNGHCYANLQRANQLILERAGVRMVEQANICTACNTEDWFSHRAEKGRSGRFGAVITKRIL